MVALISTLILRCSLMRENHRRAHLSDVEYDREASIAEPCDWVSRFYVGKQKLLSIIFSIQKFDMWCKTNFHFYTFDGTLRY